VHSHRDRDAVIGPAQYNIIQGAVDPPGFSFIRKDYYSPTEVITELRAGRPVILFASGEGGFTHYVLAVGYSGEAGTITINDPNSGRRLTLDSTATSPAISGMPENTVAAMRFVVPR